MDNDDKSSQIDTTEDSTPIPALTTLDLDTLLQDINLASNTLTFPPVTSGTYTIPNNNYTAGNYNYTFSNVNPSNALHVSGKAVFDEDVTIQGHSILTLMKKVEERLAILQPDPKKLEKYEALKKAYDHYILMEKLIGDDTEDEKGK